MLENLPHCEIASLFAVRLQKSFVQDGRSMVLEIYSKPFKKLFLVADTSKETPTLHVQTKKPAGTKSTHPLSLLLTKHGQGKTLHLRLLHQQPGLVALFHDEQTQFKLIMTFNQQVWVGLLAGDRIIASLGNATHLGMPPILLDPPPFTGLLANQTQADRYQQSYHQSMGNKLIAEQIAAQKVSIKKLEKLITNINKDREHCLRIIQEESNAELLRANLHLAQRGMASLEAVDYTTDPPCQKILILDKALSPQEFLSKLFLRIKKAKRGLSYIEPRLTETSKMLEIARNELSVLLTNDAPKMQSLPLDKRPIMLSRSPQKTERMPFKTFISSDGIKILVGKSGTDSDTLTLKMASGNDFWFHVESYPGAHVVVKCPHPALPDKTLREAALLAKHFSKAKEHPTSVVTYTRVKHVQKPKGFAPGKVLISQEKRLEITRNDQEIYQLINRR